MATTGRPRQPWTKLMDERLHRGPVAYERLLSDAAALVPPGRGYRQTIRQRASVAAARSQDSPVEPVTVREKERAIRNGQRLVAYNSLRSLVARGKVVTYVDDHNVKMVRLADSLG